MNNCIFIGVISKDIDVRYAQNGGMAVARFSLALNRDFKKEGEPTSDFINCIAFSKTAEFLGKYFSKGKRIGLTTHVQCGNYTNKDGVKVYTTDFVVDKVDFVENKSKQEEPRKSTHATDDMGFMQIEDSIVEELPFK